MLSANGSHNIRNKYMVLILMQEIKAGVSSVRPILRIGEYSLVALQHRRIRYIGLRVSGDAYVPAAITINSNRTR